MAFNEKNPDLVFGEEKAETYEEPFENEELREPPPEETLHRGLKARQISMIAVSLYFWCLMVKS